MAYSKSKVNDNGRGKSLAGFEYCHQYSDEPSEVPSAGELADGELAINRNDGLIHYRDSAGEVKAIPGGVNTNITVMNENGDAIIIHVSNGLIIGVSPA
jgi:hypothetical protein